MLYLVINIIRYSEILIVKIEKLETATGPMTPYMKLTDYAQLPGQKAITTQFIISFTESQSSVIPYCTSVNQHRTCMERKLMCQHGVSHTVQVTK